MAIRGLIIAIEEYPIMEQGFAQRLPGTAASGAAFRQWLIERKQVRPADLFFCTEAGVKGRTAGTAWPEIRAEIDRLGTSGKDKTEELYVFYCGHGFAFVDLAGKRRDNVLICSDFKNQRISGNTCLRLDEIQRYLCDALGGQAADHYYFIDACRTQLAYEEIDVGSLSLRPDASTLGEPSVYTLFSTRPGEMAAVASAFPVALIDGLEGKGRAKVWSAEDQEAMLVLFESLRKYVQSRLTGQSVTRYLEGERDGEIRRFKPAPSYVCRVSVVDGGSADAFALELRAARQNDLRKDYSFTGPSYTLQNYPPDDYHLTIRFAASACENLDPLPVSLYEECAVRFRKGGAEEAAAAAAPTEAAVQVGVPDGATLTLRNLATGDSIPFSASGLHSLQAGAYSAKLQQDDGTLLEKRELMLGEGTAAVDFAAWKPSPLREAFLERVTGRHTPGAVDFAESIGLLPDQDWGVWLAVLGASRILGRAGHYQKLEGLPLESFERLAPNHCAIWFLAAFDDPATSPTFGFTSVSGETAWVEPRRFEQFPGLFEYRTEEHLYGQYWPTWGPWTQPLLSVRVPGRPAVTIASCLLANRVTLVTVSLDEHKEIQIGQYLLPPEHLWPYLHPDVERTLRRPGKLRSVTALAQAQRMFAQRRALFAGARSQQLDRLLYLKWLDPATASMAAYELIRRNRREHLEEVATNLATYFPDFPDTYALLRLVRGVGERDGIPLFLDGLRAFPDALEKLPFPERLLDFQGPWTTWLGATK